MLTHWHTTLLGSELRINRYQATGSNWCNEDQFNQKLQVANSSWFHSFNISVISCTCISCQSQVDLVVGTPPQRVSVILDTGSGVVLACLVLPGWMLLAGNCIDLMSSQHNTRLIISRIL